MFGLSFGELMVLLLVSVIVLGPKELPKYLRKAGQLAGKLRRMAYDMREKSGIDEVLRTEGLDKEIAEIRQLARGELGGVMTAIRSTTDGLRPAITPVTRPGSPEASTAYAPTEVPGRPGPAPILIEREREFPREGADSYSALPDTAIVYDGSLPASPLAGDALYTRGEQGEAA